MIEAHSEERCNNQKNIQNVFLGSTNVEYNDGDNKDVSSKGVDTCYAFKSRLQEYAQKIGIPTPVYYTMKEGPSHQPLFRSTVTVNGVVYNSLPGFFNRKTSEQSAAEVALTEIYKSGQMIESIPTVHESGLSKNLLQEYAQKMNYAIPVYNIRRVNDSANSFICTVDIGGIQYIGTAARTKKEAEIKVARTALIAIQYSSTNDTNSSSQYTVLPGKKKGNDIADMLKPKKEKTKKKKKWPKRKFPRKNADGHTVNPGNDVDGQSVNPGIDVDGQTVNFGIDVDGQTVNPGIDVDCQTVNPGDDADGQSVDFSNSVDGQSVDFSNSVDGQSVNVVDGLNVNPSNIVDGGSLNHGNNVDGEGLYHGNNVDVLVSCNVEGYATKGRTHGPTDAMAQEKIVGCNDDDMLGSAIISVEERNQAT